MKVTTTNGRVTAEAESLSDVKLLLRMTKSNHEPRKHKKHTFKKICHRCGQVCKGNKGLAVHSAKCKKTNTNYETIRNND